MTIACDCAGCLNEAHVAELWSTLNSLVKAGHCDVRFDVPGKLKQERAHDQN